MHAHSKIAEVRVGKVAANVVGAGVTLVLCIGGIALAQLLPHHAQFANWQVIAALVLFVILLPIHEALHAVGLLCFARVRRGEVRLGVMWRSLMPYCHCTVPIPVTAYRRMALLPMWVTGGLALAWVLVFPADCFGAFAGFVLGACVGDVWLVLKLIRFSGPMLVLDHPSEIGCDVFSIAPEGAERSRADEISGVGPDGRL